MTNETNQLLKKLLNNNQFDAILSICKDEKISFADFRVLLKQNIAIFKSKSFWQSDLPHFHLSSVLESDLKITFWENYLKQDKFCNDSLNHHLLMISAEEFLQHFNLNKCFDKANFWASFQKLSTAVVGLEKVVQELTIISNRTKAIDAEEKNDNFYMLQFTLGEIMMAFTLYFNEFKQQQDVIDNRSFQTEIEVALVTELNRIFVLHKNKPTIVFEYSSNVELQKYCDRYSFSHHTLSKKGLVLPVERKTQLIFSLIKKSLVRQGKRGEISLYLNGYATFVSMNAKECWLQTNQRHRLFQLNNNKSSVEEHYFIKSFDIYTIPERTDMGMSVDILRFYGIPTEISCNSNSISIADVISLLKHFSVYKGPLEKIFYIEDQIITGNKSDGRFLDNFGSNESISVFNRVELVNGISAFFKWDTEKVISILDFLTFNLKAHDYPKNWLSKPFLMIDNHVIWMGAFLKDRRWDNIVINRFKQESEHAQFVNCISKNFELKIEDKFSKAGFSTISRHEFFTADGQKGDFDVLAYSDKSLFVCEAKSGWRSDDFSYATFLEVNRLEGCAADQLEKGQSYLKDNWGTIRSMLKIDENILLEDVTVIPIILTDYFEGDDMLYRGCYRKISLLELEVIFKNSKKQLLNMYFENKRFRDINNPNLRVDRLKAVEWNLWGKKQCLDIDIIMDAIDSNKIWLEFERFWEFSPLRYSI